MAESIWKKPNRGVTDGCSRGGFRGGAFLLYFAESGAQLPYFCITETGRLCVGFFFRRDLSVVVFYLFVVFYLYISFMHLMAVRPITP